MEIAEQDDNDVWRGHRLAELARIQLAHDQPGEALASSQRSAVIQRRLGDRSREAIAIDLTGQAYQRLDRPDDAAQFHRQAADVHRALGDHWQLAGALDRLATAVDRAGVPDQARRYRQEAVCLLNGFDDPVAAVMRERLNQALAER